jgi:hypothetical protein
MSYGLSNSGRRVLWAAALAMGLGGAASAGTVIIHSNNGAPGDSLTNTGILSGYAAASEALSNDWSYASVYRGGQIGITTNYAGAGSNGSVYLKTTGTSGSGTNNKAEIVYKPGGNLGTLGTLTSLGYDWYTHSTSMATQVPSLKILLSNGKALVWEPIYNGYTAATNPATATSIPLDTWTTSDVLLTGKFWYTGTGGIANYGYSNTLADWRNISAINSLSIVGFSSGVGSSNGYSFEGAVDNITFGFNGASTTYNFEVYGLPTPGGPAVPEPTSIAMGLIAGAAGLVMAARRRRSA